MAATLDRVRTDIDGRLKELEPVVKEFRELEQARKALGGLTTSAPSRPSSNGKRRSRAKAGGKRGRPQGSGERDHEVVAILQRTSNKKGLTVPEIAKTIGIKPNYLYRVTKRLQAEGRVTSNTDPGDKQRRWRYVRSSKP